MGIIQLITPASAIVGEEPIPRWTTMPHAKDIAAIAHVPIQFYENDGVSGFNKIEVENVNCDSGTTVSMLRKTDILWLYRKWSNIPGVPGWNVYIECLTKNDQSFSTSRILFLPFIHQASK